MEAPTNLAVERIQASSPRLLTGKLCGQVEWRLTTPSRPPIHFQENIKDLKNWIKMTPTMGGNKARRSDCF